MKYIDEKDFIKKEFMQHLDEPEFYITEDEENYYIEYEGKKIVTLYKNKINKAMEYMSKDFEDKYENIGERIVINQDNGETIKEV